jgi:hypothetical protein
MSAHLSDVRSSPKSGHYRFALVDLTHRSRIGRLRLCEAGRIYTLPRAAAHAAAKRELVATQRPQHLMLPSIFRPPEALTELEVMANQ